jgi:hypothetical protein
VEKGWSPEVLKNNVAYRFTRGTYIFKSVIEPKHRSDTGDYKPPMARKSGYAPYRLLD